MRQLVELLPDCLPIWVRAIHLCFPGIKSVGKLFLPTMLWLLGKQLRRRTLLHYGCPDELLMDMQEYGMTKGGLPANLGGTFGSVKFQEWIDKLRPCKLCPLATS